MTAVPSTARKDWTDVVSNALVFVDTSFLMHPRARDALYGTDGRLLYSVERLIVPDSVVRELEKNYNDKNNEMKRDAAEMGLKLLYDLRQANYAVRRGSHRDARHADAVILSKIQEFWVRHNMILLTQDRALARDARAIGTSRSVQSRHRIFVLCANDSGGLSHLKSATDVPAKAVPKKRTFRSVSSPVTHPDEMIGDASVAGIGRQLQSKFGMVTLIDEIARGGEGVIFQTDFAGIVAKVFHPNARTVHRIEKIERMLAATSSLPAVTWPVSLATGADNEVQGVFLPHAEGRKLATEVFLPKLLTDRHGEWTRKDLVSLAIQLAEAVRYLHALGVIVGDLNPQNILVTDDARLTIVDTDSFQIEGYTCPVGMVTFTPPELQGKQLAGVLRTESHDAFALASMIFMILMPGKPPYSQQGGGDPAANIKAGQFPYPFGHRGGTNQPAGPWRTMWSNLPYKVKEAFHRVFADKQRLTAAEWAAVLKKYAGMLERGHVTDEIFPMHFKGISEEVADRYGLQPTTGRLVQVSCTHCGSFFSADESTPDLWIFGEDQRALCPTHARAQGSMITCDCGETFLFSFADQASYNRKDLRPPKRCAKCRARRNLQCGICGNEFRALSSEVERFTFAGRTLCDSCADTAGTPFECIDCGDLTVYSYREQAFHDRKGYVAPKRCKACRNSRKANAGDERQ
ncbi:zinc-ribbon domain containing protein [Mycobacterium sp. SMC-4]|uniref:zinc-ribbon domain containing protein n=1 Tax=Mycobacterium sp. SMC-4 TaxID=2857059 RepID=UPI0021B24D56|nr:zinc-ribbon domain containing protein [Mycobacterium sp. SMC-4]UXA17462.1 zinc-ribbon domain containing protein [Mycobacterium sp. SMC-4]